ncbi:MAG TPA: hypothetical protein VGH23_16085 [Rhizomicrobium sp.]|jgi:hypothetical protein
MAESGEIMMAMTKPDALQHIEITVLRQMGENIAAQTRHLETLSGKVDDVRERVIRIEAKETEKAVEALSARVATLEARGNQARGVAAFGSWLVQAAPWLMTAIVVIAALLGIGKK